jgi:hypothetical protein
MKALKTTWTGIRPLVMHSAAMIDPDNPNVRLLNQMQRALKKLKKEDEEGREEQRRKIERVEWEASLYFDGERLFVPGDNIMRCIQEGARKSKAGKQAESGLLPVDDSVIHTTVKGKINLDSLFQDKAFSLRQAVRIPPRTGSRIMKVRPMVPTGWSITFDVEYDEKVLATEALKEAMKDAGTLIGLGDWRPKFGRFEVSF